MSLLDSIRSLFEGGRELEDTARRVKELTLQLKATRAESQVSGAHVAERKAQWEKAERAYQTASRAGVAQPKLKRRAATARAKYKQARVGREARQYKLSETKKELDRAKRADTPARRFFAEANKKLQMGSGIVGAGAAGISGYSRGGALGALGGAAMGLGGVIPGPLGGAFLAIGGIAKAAEVAGSALNELASRSAVAARAQTALAFSTAYASPGMHSVKIQSDLLQMLQDMRIGNRESAGQRIVQEAKAEKDRAGQYGTQVVRSEGEALNLREQELQRRVKEDISARIKRAEEAGNKEELANAKHNELGRMMVRGTKEEQEWARAQAKLTMPGIPDWVIEGAYMAREKEERRQMKREDEGKSKPDPAQAQRRREMEEANRKEKEEAAREDARNKARIEAGERLTQQGFLPDMTAAGGLGAQIRGAGGEISEIEAMARLGRGESWATVYGQDPRFRER